MDGSDPRRTRARGGEKRIAQPSRAGLNSLDMRTVMRNALILAAMGLTLSAAMPLAAQDQPAPPAPAQDQDNKPSAPVPAQSQQPTLEKPTTAPETQAPPPAKAPAKTSATKKPAEKTDKAAEKPVEGINSRTVEEIIARVNNEIITRSELDKARVTAQEDAEQDCKGRC